MFKKLFMLFKIGRKLSTSGAISSIYEIYSPPAAIKILFLVIGFSFVNKKNNNNLSSGQKLCNALQEMGTTFIKLGQFLATRPDIIGEDISKELEKLQDKLPAFDLIVAKNILKKELGKENFEQITNISPEDIDVIIDFDYWNSEKQFYSPSIKLPEFLIEWKDLSPSNVEILVIKEIN